MESYLGGLWLVRLLLQRALAAIYLLAFLNVLLQFKPLLGERGLLPAPAFLRRIRFLDSPTIFYRHYSDRKLTAAAWAGLTLSTLALFGISESGPALASIAVWLVLYVLYLSIVNIGQVFYGFGWEAMLLEAGFFAAFLGPARFAPSAIPVLILRWMLFRTEIGAGLIKLRHDRCWRELTCLFYHYETQPLPNPLSWYFHRLPKFMHQFAVLFSHFVQVGVPFALFAPQPIAAAAGGLIIFHQLWLIVSGNYSWLNWLTVALGISAFNDSILGAVLPLHPVPAMPRPVWFNVLLYAIGGSVALLSIQPAMNLFSRKQLMNYSYNRFHLVNTYGAFGSITRKRYEIVIEGTIDPVLSPNTQWLEYELKAKPGDPRRMPPQIAPWHLRLDWLMWFLPFSVAVTSNGILTQGHDVWFVRLIRKLLENDRATLKLLRRNPFELQPPTFVRALFYLYRYTNSREKQETGAWWKRELIDVYLPPMSLADFQRPLITGQEP
jgi:Lipase maturation factor